MSRAPALRAIARALRTHARRIRQREGARARMPHAPAPCAIACALRAHARRVGAKEQRSRLRAACVCTARDRTRAACAGATHPGEGDGARALMPRAPAPCAIDERFARMRDASGPRNSTCARVPRAFA
eukprot:263815-Pleurochrysis_carterae.AAC.1